MNKYVSAVAVTVLAAAAVSAANAQSVVATVTLPNLPEGVAVNPLTNRVYVAVPNFGAQPFDYVTVINGKTNTIVKNIEIPPVALADRHSTKKALKGALAPWLPPSILNRRKMGFAMPLRKWTGNGFMSSGAIDDLVDSSVVQKIVSGEADRTAVTHSLFFLQRWLARWS